MSPLSFVLAAQGFKPQDAAGIVPPLGTSVRRVPSLDRSALGKLLAAQGAGGETESTITLSAARMVSPGRADLRLYGARSVDAHEDDVLFDLVPNGAATASIVIRGLKKGKTYLMVVNCDARNAHARMAYGSPDLGYGVLEMDAPSGASNLPCLFKAVAKEELLTVAFSLRAQGGGAVHLSSIDVHEVK